MENKRLDKGAPSSIINIAVVGSGKVEGKQTQETFQACLLP